MDVGQFHTPGCRQGRMGLRPPPTQAPGEQRGRCCLLLRQCYNLPRDGHILWCQLRLRRRFWSNPITAYLKGLSALAPQRLQHHQRRPRSCNCLSHDANEASPAPQPHCDDCNRPPNPCGPPMASLYAHVGLLVPTCHVARPLENAIIHAHLNYLIFKKKFVTKTR